MHIEIHHSHFVVNFDGKRLKCKIKTWILNFPGISCSEDWKRWQIT